MFLNKKLDKLIIRKYKIALLLPSILIHFLTSQATGRTSANVHQKKIYLEQWINIEHISLGQGLFQISVSYIAQDSKGFIWFGTQGELNRYNDYDLIAFKHHPDKSTTLNTNWVTDLYTNQKGTLWIVTTDGILYKFNAENENFKRLLINTSYKIQGVFVNAIFMDRNGLMRVDTAGQGLITFN
jgi:ligand-binding sensor domain-containing protein